MKKVILLGDVFVTSVYIFIGKNIACNLLKLKDNFYPIKSTFVFKW